MPLILKAHLLRLLRKTRGTENLWLMMDYVLINHCKLKIVFWKCTSIPTYHALWQHCTLQDHTAGRSCCPASHKSSVCCLLIGWEQVKIQNSGCIAPLYHCNGESQSISWWLSALKVNTLNHSPVQRKEITFYRVYFSHVISLYTFS